MANYTFTTTSKYDLKTHKASFTSTTLTIEDNSGTVVFSQKYGTGLAFECQNSELHIGTLQDNGTFINKVDYDLNPKAKIWIESSGNDYVLIGTDDEGDASIYNRYTLNQCPVRLSENKDVVTIECPCEKSSGPCNNSCYKYGK